METLDLFSNEEGIPSIEDIAFDNGKHFWYASDVALAMGYDDYPSFTKTVLNKAISVCMTAGFQVVEHFEQCRRNKDGIEIADFKLSRFAFFLTAINGNLAKPEVQSAQAYFAAFADAASKLIEEQQIGDRLLIRGEISKGVVSLDKVAGGHGVVDFARFHNAGYMGMYNMSSNRLRDVKGVPSDRSPLDFMGQRELAANLFRLNETKERINTRKVFGASAVESTARNVGAEVREFMTRDGGAPPEALPPHRDIQEVKKSLKSTGRELKKLDSPKKKPRKKK